MAEHDDNLADLEKQLADLEEKIASVTKADADTKAKDDDADDEAAVAAKKAKAAKSLKKADDNSDADSYDDMSDEDDDEEDDSASKSAKKAVAKKGADDLAKLDETVVIDGQTIAKSAVGDVAFTIFKAQADRLKKAEEDIAKERDLRVTAEFKKQADDLYKHVPGSVDERADMLKAISTMDAKLQKSFTKVFDQSEKLAKSAFETIGTKGGDQDVKKAAQTFETKVAEIAKRDGIKRTEAMAKARLEYPDEFKAFQDQGN